MSRFFEDLLLFFLAFYLVRKLVGYVLSKLSGNTYTHSSNDRHTSAGRQDGNIRVNFVPPKKKSSIDEGDGEFVEYEEIKSPKKTE